MGDGSNLLIIFLCINIVLYIGVNGMGSTNANLVKDDLFTNSGLLKLTGDKVTMGDAVTEKPTLQSANVLSDVVSFKVFDAISILWDFIMSLLNILTLPFTLMYNLFSGAQLVGKYISMLIFAPLTIGYIYAIWSFIKGVGN